MVPKIIWMYWENKKGHSKPAYLELCLETIQRHRGAYELRLLDEKSVTDWLEIPPVVKKLENIAHKADYARFELLAKYGGVWFDADVVLLTPLEEIVDVVDKRYDFIGYGREYGKPSINFMACERGCPLMVDQVEGVRNLLAKKKTGGVFRRRIPLVWTEIGHDILWPLAAEYDYFHYPREAMAPVFWEDWRLFLSEDADEQEVLSNSPMMVMLYNDFLFSHLRQFSRAQLMKSEMLVSRLLNIALE